MIYSQEIISSFDYSDVSTQVRLLVKDKLNPARKFKLTVETYAINDDVKEQALLAKLIISPKSIDSDELCFSIEGMGNEIHGYTFLGYMVDVAKKYCNCIKSKYHHHSSDTWECIEEYEKFLMEGARLCS